MGDFETRAPALVESSLKYHLFYFWNLTMSLLEGLGHCMAGSLTGAVASQRVTEARNGKLRLDGNQFKECNGTSLPDCESDSSSRDESRS